LYEILEMLQYLTKCFPSILVQYK